MTFDELVAQAKASLAAMSPEEVKAMWKAQRESWTRGTMALIEEPERMEAMTDQVELIVARAIRIAQQQAMEDISSSGGSYSQDHLDQVAARAAIAAMQPQPVAELGDRRKALIDALWKDNAIYWSFERGDDIPDASLDAILAALSQPAEPSTAMIEAGERAYNDCQNVAAIYSAMITAKDKT